MQAKTCLRKVVNFVPVGACRYTGYVHRSLRLILECGHDQVRKESRGVPRRARCRGCERLAYYAVQAAEQKKGKRT